MRAFIADHWPLLAMWLSIGVGITDRRGAGGGAAASGPGGAGSPIGLLLVLTQAS